ncbi:acyl-homoserine-lactone synthase [Vibrio sp. SCSIO 43136]|uniref:acyl-homoserine-lactone synthase n=1 Tax=Vibrio sp. SCSIO 43136 TaxID=2819101 RepID=UPI0020763555|nr:acyl-homoserine-lactone synthase [Vibrio sp. SCSIO 43136]USD67214.1 GNAT family N-acetyltransferase [Vibrio sp. SCSIO 43136]
MPTTLADDLFRFRHAIFIEQLGWELPLTEEQQAKSHELDQFDADNTVYVMGKESDGQVFGCARLLPTTEPYLLEQVFPELLNGLAPPKSADIWELSRFACIDTQTGHTGVTGFDDRKAVELLRYTMGVARTHGAKKMISVSPYGVERLLRKEGFSMKRLGPPVKYDGYVLIACLIDIL